MYENITYAELKKLPKEQKPEAWKELKALYSSTKELASRLGVSSSIVYNMIARYVGGKTDGKKKEENDEIAEIQDNQIVVPQPEKTRKRGVRKKRDIVVMETDPASVAADNAAVAEAESAPEADTFSISIKKTISGEDAQFFLNGIGNTLLKNQKYVIEVKISEK